jgi:hygromycin-B 4-O-kinase
MIQITLLTLEEATQFLNAHYNGGVSGVRQLGAGAWSQAFYFEQAGQRLVIRWSKHTEFFERDQIAATYSSSALPVPKMLDMGSALGLHYAITEFATGSYFDEITAHDLEQTLPAFFAMLDAIRAVDLKDAAGYGLWSPLGVGASPSWKEFLLSVRVDNPDSATHGWLENLQSSEFGTKDFEELYRELQKAVTVCPERCQLIHSDLLNYNLLVKDHMISAVLDWGSSMYGDALYDVAWIMYCEFWYPEFMKIKLSERLLQYVSAQPDVGENIEERLLAYKLHIGLGSIAYNAYQKQWDGLQVAIDRTRSFLKTQ